MGLKYYFQINWDGEWKRAMLSKPATEKWETCSNLAERQMFLDSIYLATEPRVPMRLINQMGKVSYIREPEKPPTPNEDTLDEPESIDWFNTCCKLFVFGCFMLFVFVIGYAIGRVHLTRSLEGYVETGQRNELVDDFAAIMEPHFQKVNR